MVNSEDLRKSALLIGAIYITCLVIIATPLYIYGLLKWFQFQSHFIITKRFPLISTAIIMLSYINLIASSCGLWTNYIRGFELRQDGEMSWRNIERGFNQGIVFIVTGLIIERLILIYLRCKRSETKLNECIDTTEGTDNKPKDSQEIADNSHSDRRSIDIPSNGNKPDSMEEHKNRIKIFEKQNRSLYKHWISIIWLTYVFSAYFIIQTKYITNIYPKSLFLVYTWTFMLLFGIICLFWIICAKVNEGIGCFKEAYLTLSWLLILFPLTLTLSTASPFLVIPLVTIGPLQGLLPIYFSLYYIYKSEKTLNVPLWQNKHKSEIYPKTRVSISSQFDPVGPMDFDLPCLVFLENLAHYNIFSEYLAHCFALENLLFVERVSVFHQICKIYSKPDNLQCTIINEETEEEKEENKDDKNKEQVHRIKFRYSSYNKTYNDRITKVLSRNIDNNDSFDDYKKIFYSICKEIFDEFIMVDSEHEVNLSFESKSTLTMLLGGDGNMDKFKLWQDFMCLFDDCLVEIYVLIISIYKYRFKAYVSTK